MRAPGAETPTPILGYEYSFGSPVRVAPPEIAPAPNSEECFRRWTFGVGGELCRCWKLSKPHASHTNTPELGSASQRRGRAPARLSISNLSKSAQPTPMGLGVGSEFAVEKPFRIRISFVFDLHPFCIRIFFAYFAYFAVPNSPIFRGSTSSFGCPPDAPLSPLPPPSPG